MFGHRVSSVGGGRLAEMRVTSWRAAPPHPGAGLLRALIVTARLGAVAAIVHRAPASRVVAAGVDEQPSAAAVILALAHARCKIRGEHVGGRSHHRPQDALKRVRALCPSPGEAGRAGPQAGLPERLGQPSIQQIERCAWCRLAVGQAAEDPIDRLSQLDRPAQNADGLPRTPPSFERERPDFLLAEDAPAFGPGQQFGVARQSFLGMIAGMPLGRVGKIQTQGSSRGICVFGRFRLDSRVHAPPRITLKYCLTGYTARCRM